jgi:hypothetical protein
MTNYWGINVPSTRENWGAASRFGQRQSFLVLDWKERFHLFGDSFDMLWTLCARTTVYLPQNGTVWGLNETE